MDDGILSLPDYWHKYKHDISEKRKWIKTTMRDYDNKLAKLVEYSPFLKNKPISSLNYMDLNNAVKNVRPHGPRGNPYSESTVLGFFSLLSDIFSYAEFREHAENILQHYRPGRKRLTEQVLDIERLLVTADKHESIIKLRAEIDKRPYRPRSLSIGEMSKLYKRILANIDKDGRYCALAFVLYAGPRPAEVRAIRWDDIHPIDGHEEYFAALCRTLDPQGKPKDTMKTDNAYRGLPIHNELLYILKRRWDVIQRSANASSPTYICCYKNNFTQPCTQAQLAIFAKDVLTSIVDEDTLQMNVLEAALDDITNPTSESSYESFTLYVLRRNFWTWMLGQTELDNLEKRYLMGHEMLVEGVNVRGAYNNPEALWRMAQKMNQFGIDPSLHTEKVTIKLDAENPTGGRTDAGIVNISVPSNGGTLIIQATSLNPSDPIHLSMRKPPSTVAQISGEYTLTDMPASIPLKSSINLERDNWIALEKAKKRHRKTPDGAENATEKG